MRRYVFMAQIDHQFGSAYLRLAHHGLVGLSGLGGLPFVILTTVTPRKSRFWASTMEFQQLETIGAGTRQ